MGQNTCCLKALPFGFRGMGLTLTTDNGTQFMSVPYVDTRRRLGITHLRTAYNHPEGNSYIERFQRSLKEEVCGPTSTRSSIKARRASPAGSRSQSRPRASWIPWTNPARGSCPVPQTPTSDTAQVSSSKSALQIASSSTENSNRKLNYSITYWQLLNGLGGGICQSREL